MSTAAPHRARLRAADRPRAHNSLIAFVRDTQANAWDKLVDLAESEHNMQISLLKRVAAQLDKRGTIELLRGGLTEQGVALALAYFEPDLEVEPTARILYEANGCGSCGRCASTRAPVTAWTSCCSSTACRPRPRS